jgi:hypothetical protein
MFRHHTLNEFQNFETNVQDIRTQMAQKREASGDLKAPQAIKSLKTSAFLEAFKLMDLPERQAILPELLKMAKIVNGYALNCVSPDFVRWICSGDTKEWPQEDVERGWEMWNFLCRRSMGGRLHSYEYHVGEVWSPLADVDMGCELEQFRDEREDRTDKTITRRSFFNIILKEFTPEKFRFWTDAGGEIMSFAKYMQKGEVLCEGGVMMPLVFDHLEDEYVGYVRDLVPDPRLDPVSYPPVNK